MKNQSTLFQTIRLLGVAAMLVAFLPACNVADEASDLSEADVQAISDVVADALSDRNEGLVTDLYDMTADLGTTELTYSSLGVTATAASKFGPGWRSWHGPFLRYALRYDSLTGEHKVHYERNIESPRFSKTMLVDLAYIFYNANNGFVQYPRRDRALVTKINFKGTRAGSMDMTNAMREHHSSFTRQAAWTLNNVNGTEMTLEGEQTHEGTYTGTGKDDQNRARHFKVHMVTNEVKILKPVANTDSLESLVSGQIKYSVEITKTINGKEETKTQEGTIELTGNGDALLRFMGLNRTFRVDLSVGEVEEEK